jgi:hypothetical protein
MYKHIVAFVCFGKGLSCSGFATNRDDILSILLLGKCLLSRSVDRHFSGVVPSADGRTVAFIVFDVVLSPSFYTMWVLSVRIGHASIMHVPLSGLE